MKENEFTPSIPSDKFFERTSALTGEATLRQLKAMSVIVVNLGGVGIETAKTAILSGVKKVTIIDDSYVSPSDSLNNWFFREEYVNKRKSQVYLSDLKELSEWTEVTKEPLSTLDDPQMIKRTNVVILTEEYDLEKIKAINQRCRLNRVGFILANSVGLMSNVFVDYGTLRVVDKYYSGFNDQFYIRNISNAKEGQVTISSIQPHFLQTGDYVSISEVKGMHEVNGEECRPIKVIDGYNFTIENTLNYGKYRSGGVVSYERVPLRVAFSSFEDNMVNPVFSDTHTKKQMELHVATLLYYDIVKKRETDESLKDYSKIEKRLDSLFLELFEENQILMEIRRNHDIENYKVIEALRLILSNEKVCILPVAKMIASLATFQMIVNTGRFYPIKQHIYMHFEDEFPEELPKAFQKDPQNGLTTFYKENSATMENAMDHTNMK